MNSFVAAVIHSGASSSSRAFRRLRGIAPAALLLGGLLTVVPGPLAAPVAATAPANTVAAWGLSGGGSDGHVPVPADLSGVTAISAGSSHGLALKSNGTVVAFGGDLAGQSDVPAGLSGVTAVAAGSWHSLALKSDGTVVAWGGIGVDQGQATVPLGLSGVTAIAGGYYHSLALKSDGTVVGWGNSWGATVPPGLKNVVAISAGGYLSLALKSDGTVVGWGLNDYGFATVPAGLKDVIAISAGGEFGLALKSDHTVVAWGWDVFGQADVPIGLSNVVAISAGQRHSLALKSDGTVVAWGENGYGESTVPTGLANATAIAAGYGLSLALVPAPYFTVSTANPWLAGSAHDVTVTARGAHGGAASWYIGTAHLTTSDPAATVPLNYTFTMFDGGVHTFADDLDLPLRLKTAGTVSVTATDTANSSITGTQTGIVVNATALSRLVVSGLTPPRPAGTTGSVRVTATDAYGNRVHSYLGTIHLTSSDAQAKLPANYTFTVADAGTHVFSGTLTLKTAGTQSVTATDTVTATLHGSQTGIVVTPAALSKLVVSGLGSPRQAGIGGSIRVTATDTYGNRVQSYRGTIHLTSSDAQAKLPANYTFTVADAGTHVFSGTLTLKTAGTQSVTATDTVTATLKSSQTGIVVTAAALSKFVVSGLGSPRPAGIAGSLRVTATDAYGNRIVGYLGTIHLTSTDTAAKLPANYTFVVADAGTHVFNGTVILKTKGTWSITATDTVTATLKGSQTGIVVN